MDTNNDDSGLRRQRADLSSSTLSSVPGGGFHHDIPQRAEQPSALQRSAQHENPEVRLSHLIALVQTQALPSDRHNSVDEHAGDRSIVDRTDALNELGQAYLERSQGSRHDNVEQAITWLEQALSALGQRDRLPYAWAVIQNNLGNAYRFRVEGRRDENLQQALQHFDAALDIFIPDQYGSEWATSQHNRGLVLLDMGESVQEAPDRAIEAFEAAAQVFGRTPASPEWATLQNSLGAAYTARLFGEHELNLERAVTHHRAALAVFTIDAYPAEYAMTQQLLGNVYQSFGTGNRNDRLEATIGCYEAALVVHTAERFPRQYAMAQSNLGVAYMDLITGDRHENLTRALTCYANVQRLCTRDSAPLEWAGARNNLGNVHVRLADVRSQEYDEHLEAARRCFTDALEIYTVQTFPREHRLIQWNVGNMEARWGNWEAAHSAYAQAHVVEDLLLDLGVGIEGRDEVRRENWDAHVRDAFALTQLKRSAEAAVTLEAGRGRELARAWAIEETETRGDGTETVAAARSTLSVGDDDPDGRYRAALAAVHAAQVALASRREPTDTTSVVTPRRSSPSLVRTDLEQMQQLRRAEEALAVAVTARASRRTSTGYSIPLDAETLLHVATKIGPRHVLAYLAATPWGGVAIMAIAGDTDGNDTGRYAILGLPSLTYEFVTDLIETSLADGSTRAIGGFAHAQEGRTLECLWHDWRADTLSAQVAQLRDACAAWKQPSTLLDATSAALAIPDVALLAVKPLDTLDAHDVHLLANTLNAAFMEAELAQVGARLKPTLLQPLTAWLQDQGASGLTLIPCGWLAALPLTAMFCDEISTLGDCLPTSVAPCVRALLSASLVLPNDRRGQNKRAGVFAVGNPHPTHQDLPWGEAEAFTLARLARQAGLPAGCRVQEHATRSWLADRLVHGRVVVASCHGSFDVHRPLHSHLSLAGDARLTLAEVLSGAADLRGLRLLVLSACQSATAHLRGATDEVRGIATGMLQAGAHAVLASLWTVDDEATYLLIVRFAQEWFPRLDEEPPAAALARAQRWLRTVTNDELRTWRTTMATMPVEVSPAHASLDQVTRDPESAPAVSAARMMRGPGYWQPVTRLDADQAVGAVRARAWDEGGQEQPFADPLFWAGFQVFGW